jgi:hypothetical protein
MDGLRAKYDFEKEGGSERKRFRMLPGSAARREVLDPDYSTEKPRF